MKVLLRMDVEHVGRMGQIVNVAEGYARNYLFPRGLAVSATPDNERRVEAERVRREARHASLARDRQALAQKLKDRSVTITAKATEDDQLYGSVGAEQIVEALQRDDGTVIDAQWIRLEEPIRKIGIFDVPVHLADDAQATIKVWVVSETGAGAPAEARADSAGETK